MRHKIAIEFKSAIVDSCVFRQEPYKRLPGERQVLEFIGVSNIFRILVGFEGRCRDKAIYEISKICEPYYIAVMAFIEAERIEVDKTYVYK